MTDAGSISTTATTVNAGIRTAGAAAAGTGTTADANGRKRIPAAAETISARNRVLNKDPLCSTKIQIADAINRKITTVTEKMCGKPHIFFHRDNFQGTFCLCEASYK